jgi:hypothetical protein
MPSEQATAREVRVVRDVVRWLRDQGAECVIRAWPDRNPHGWPTTLTVEAVLAIGEAGAVDWALDVMTVPVPQEVVSSTTDARREILPEVAVMAEQAKRAVIVSLRFVGDATTRHKYFEHVLRLVQEALDSGDDYYDDSGADKETHVLLQPGEFIGPPDGPLGAVRANLMFSTSETGDLVAQLRNTIIKPLTKKLSNQLRRAKDLGYPTVLALDQLGHEGLPGGTAWLPSTNAVTTVVAEACALHPGVLDAAVLATPKGTITPIFGNRFRAS